MIYGIGIDCHTAGETERSWRRFGDQYLRRGLAPAEIAAIAWRAEPAEHQIRLLTSLFATKEAIYKALRPPTGLTGGWPEIDLAARLGQVPQPADQRMASGGAEIGTTGDIDRWRQGIGVGDIHLSFTNTDDVVVAMAIAETLAFEKGR